MREKNIITKLTGRCGQATCGFHFFVRFFNNNPICYVSSVSVYFRMWRLLEPRSLYSTEVWPSSKSSATPCSKACSFQIREFLMPPIVWPPAGEDSPPCLSSLRVLGTRLIIYDTFSEAHHRISRDASLSKVLISIRGDTQAGWPLLIWRKIASWSQWVYHSTHWQILILGFVFPCLFLRFFFVK